MRRAPVFKQLKWTMWGLLTIARTVYMTIRSLLFLIQLAGTLGRYSHTNLSKAIRGAKKLKWKRM
jgi:hypothetical protein